MKKHNPATFRRSLRVSNEYIAISQSRKRNSLTDTPPKEACNSASLLVLRPHWRKTKSGVNVVRKVTVDFWERAKIKTKPINEKHVRMDPSHFHHHLNNKCLVMMETKRHFKLRSQ